MPGLRLPIANASGYFVPTLQLDETAYELQNQTLGNPDGINRTLPMFNIDSGLFSTGIFILVIMLIPKPWNHACFTCGYQ